MNRRSRAWARNAEVRPVIVNLVDGSAVRGLLWRKDGDLVIIHQAEVLEGAARAVPADGVVLVPVAMVRFVQVLPSQAPARSTSADRRSAPA